MHGHLFPLSLLENRHMDIWCELLMVLGNISTPILNTLPRCPPVWTELSQVLCMFTDTVLTLTLSYKAGIDVFPKFTERNHIISPKSHSSELD